MAVEARLTALFYKANFMQRLFLRTEKLVMDKVGRYRARYDDVAVEHDDRPQREVDDLLKRGRVVSINREL